MWVCPPGRSFANTAGGKGDLSDNLIAATRSGWMRDQDAMTIFSVSEMYLMAVICLFWAWDSFCVAHKFYLPCHISNKWWTLPILCNFHSSASFFISESFSVSDESNSGSGPANNPLLARANIVTTTSSHMVLHIIFDCLHLITSRTREELAPTLTPCGMIENMSCATLEILG